MCLLCLELTSVCPVPRFQRLSRGEASVPVTELLVPELLGNPFIPKILSLCGTAADGSITVEGFLRLLQIIRDLDSSDKRAECELVKGVHFLSSFPH
jgi:hypothetical protein